MHYWENKSIRLHKDSMFWLFICGFCSGVFWGAPMALMAPAGGLWQYAAWSAKHFRATLQAYFLPASLMGIAGYFIKGLF